MHDKIKEYVVRINLSHPTLVRLFGVLIDAEYGPCLVLDLCKGGSLRSVLNRAHDRAISVDHLMCVKHASSG